VEELPLRTRADAQSKTVAASAAEGGFFYLLGGDPGRLLQILAGSAVWLAIEARWRAGAMALGQ